MIFLKCIPQSQYLLHLLASVVGVRLLRCDATDRPRRLFKVCLNAPAENAALTHEDRSCAL